MPGGGMTAATKGELRPKYEEGEELPESSVEARRARLGPRAGDRRG